VRIAEDLGVEAEVVLYQKNPPSEERLRWILGHLEDPITELVRRDAVFAKLGLSDADVATVDQIVTVLTKYPKLMQRPVVTSGNVAIVGRPKDRITKLLNSVGESSVRLAGREERSGGL
jgi:arsenate reductase (glutaredoxin)